MRILLIVFIVFAIIYCAKDPEKEAMKQPNAEKPVIDEEAATRAKAEKMKTKRDKGVPQQKKGRGGAGGQKAAPPGGGGKNAAPGGGDQIDFGRANRIGGSKFDVFVSSRKVVFVEFYAPWCGHCKRSGPEIKKVVEMTQGMEDIAIGVVDCTVEQELCQKHQVQSYPTIFTFIGGVKQPYTGERSSEAIFAHLMKLSGGALKEFETMEGLTRPFVIGSFAEETDYFEALQLISTAEDVECDMYFGMNNEELIKDFGVNSVKVYPARGEDFVVNYEDIMSIDQAKLQKVIVEATEPLIPELNRNTIMKLQAKQLPFVVMFFEGKSPQRAEIVGWMEGAHADFKDKVVLTWSDYTDSQRQYTAMGGYETDSMPNVVYFDLQTQYTHCRRDAEGVGMSEEILRAWITGVMDGTIKRKVKTQPIPETQDEKVYVIVGDSYEDVVMKDTTRDKLIKFHAPWCGHCKRLAPIWEKLATILEPVKDKILIADFDKTENDVIDENVIVRGFPTLVYYNPGGHVQYTREGDRTFPALAEFVLENCNPEIKDELEALLRPHIDAPPSEEEFKEL